MSPLDAFPGGERVQRGLADARARQWTANALLVASAPSRLRALGFDVPRELPADPELALYALLEGERDPYARYNALRRELDSFLAAYEAHVRRAGSSA